MLSLIVGNIFSLLSATCIAISVLKKNKKDLIWWQIIDAVFSILSNIALYTYAALTTNFVAVIRNILAYNNKLTKSITGVLVLLCIIAGFFANNRGVIGILPVVASAGYTIFMFTTKNEQQMRWALIFNLTLWFIHDVYVQAYPTVLIKILLIGWTFIKIFQYVLNKKRL